MSHQSGKIASGFPARMKQEEEDVLVNRQLPDELPPQVHQLPPHSHKFTVKFDQNADKYTFICCKPSTVLEAMKSNKVFEKMVCCADGNLMIQRGSGDLESTIATHFPCTCIEDECLTVLAKKEIIEKAEHQPTEICPKTKYSVFYIDINGGKNTKTKKFFRSKKIKNYRYVCVYGKKETTVEDALREDGRFIDELETFKLADHVTGDFTVCSQSVRYMDQKKYRMCLPKMEGGVKPEESPQEGKCTEKKEMSSGDCCTPKLPFDMSCPVIVTKSAMQNQNDDSDSLQEKVPDQLRQRYAKLREWMIERFPGNSFQEELKLKKENFGKIWQSFSEVHRVRGLLKRGESVCKIVVENAGQGTGFVFFDNFVLTNAHLFPEGIIVQDKLMRNVQALFGDDDPEPQTDYCSFSCKETVVVCDRELDFALLELNKGGPIPAGLLKEFGEVPKGGEACVIGYPANVKQMDPTCIIEKEERIQEINNHLENDKDNPFAIQSISHLLNGQGIEKGLGKGANVFQGSSGSPLFDRDLRVIAMHTLGFTHVMGFAHPLTSIFSKLVHHLKNKSNLPLLARVQEEIKQNQTLTSLMEKLDDTPMDIVLRTVAPPYT